MPEGVAICAVQYVLQRIAVAVFGGLGFFFCGAYMNRWFGEYRMELILGYGLTAVICLILILACVSGRFHRTLAWLGRKADRKHKYENKIMQMEGKGMLLRQETVNLIKDRRDIILVLLMELAKLGCWYVIPYMILHPAGSGIFRDGLRHFANIDAGGHYSRRLAGLAARKGCSSCCFPVSQEASRRLPPCCSTGSRPIWFLVRLAASVL